MKAVIALALLASLSVAFAALSSSFENSTIPLDCDCVFGVAPGSLYSDFDPDCFAPAASPKLAGDVVDAYILRTIRCADFDLGEQFEYYSSYEGEEGEEGEGEEGEGEGEWEEWEGFPYYYEADGLAHTRKAVTKRVKKSHKTDSPQPLSSANKRCNKERDGGDCEDAYNPAAYACSATKRVCYSVPAAWTCDPSWYNQNYHTPQAEDRPDKDDDVEKFGNGILNACHCGCGAPDPDCGEPIANERIYCAAKAYSDVDSRDLVEGDADTQYCHAPTGACLTVPDGWTCPAYLYNQVESWSVPYLGHATCDCNCGVWDPDCGYARETTCWPTIIPPSTDVVVNSTDFGEFDCEESTDGCNEESLSESESESESESGEGEGEAIDYSHAYCSAKTNDCLWAPEHWTCPPRWYNEMESGNYGPNGIPDCNCGCGAPDPDCYYEDLRQTLGPNNFGLYGEGEGDTPAGYFTPIYDPKKFCAIKKHKIWEAPDGWSCPSRAWNEWASGNYGQNGKSDCDCNCGEVYDPDCVHEDVRALNDDSSLGLYCNEGSNQESTDFRQTCAQSINKCVTVPTEWANNCPAKTYNQIEYENMDTRGIYFCDCHCGSVYDPDCNFQQQRFDNATTFGLACDSTGEDDGNAAEYCSMQFGDAMCRTVSSQWTCAPSFYDEINSQTISRGKPYCDCSCGDWDPDCYTDTRGTEGFGSFGLLCNNDGVESVELREYCVKKNILKNQENDGSTPLLPVCSKAAPSWFCAGISWNEFDSLSYDPQSGITCDCGCGSYDYDCNSTISSSYLNYMKCAPDGSRMVNVLNTLFSCPTNCPFCGLTQPGTKPQ